MRRSLAGSPASGPPRVEVLMLVRPARRVVVAAVLALSAAAVAPAATASSHRGHSQERSGSFTYAVYGDAPYGTTPDGHDRDRRDAGLHRFVNADPEVCTVLHVGDIHSGKQYCTQAYDQPVYDLWTGFADPLVYTPGDNEWTDCHKAAEGGGAYNPATGQIDYVKDAERQPGRLRRRQPGRQPRPGAVDLLRDGPGGTLGSGQPAGALPGTGRRPRAPDRRAVRRERDVGAATASCS